MISLVAICYHRKLLETLLTVFFMLYIASLSLIDFKTEFVPLNLPYLLPAYPLPHICSSGNYQFLLCLNESFIFVCFQITSTNQKDFFFPFDYLLSIIHSRSIYIVPNGKISNFYFMGSMTQGVCTYTSHLLHLCISR